jgi:hypothetical protein
MDYMKEAFEVLSKGIIISTGSQKYHNIANFLSVDENFEALKSVVDKIGYYLVGESGYFYLSKKGLLSREDVNYFVDRHKKTIVAISVLKQIFPVLSVNSVIKQSKFIVEYDKRGDELLRDKLLYLSSSEDIKTEVEELFSILQKSFVLEQNQRGDRDSYKVLSALSYYLKIVDSAF